MAIEVGKKYRTKSGIVGLVDPGTIVTPERESKDNPVLVRGRKTPELIFCAVNGGALFFSEGDLVPVG